MTRIKKAFLAYPDGPPDLAEPIKKAVLAVTIGGKAVTPSVLAWPSIDAFGANIPDQIRQEILASDTLVCDVTIPNMNVYYEAGFAIGSGKSIAPIINASFADATTDIQKDGLFDNIGYKTYENSQDIVDLLSSLPRNNLVDLYSRNLNREQPLFFLDAYRKTDFRNAIVSSIKKSNVFYRSFDPSEVPRLSTVSVLADATASSGIIIPILAEHVDDSARHNLRAAFLAGLSHGLGRQTLLLRLQRDGAMDPADYRQLITHVRNADETTEVVEAFAKLALIAGQSIRQADARREKTALQRLTLGASAAENEFRTLEEYFVETAEFLRTARGEINIVAGRKGSGKTAIFFRVRDGFRQNKKCLVIDLKPESHQLSLFREELLKIVDIGVFDHTLAAFWYYVILTEILLGLKKHFEYESKFSGDALRASGEISETLEQMGARDSGDFTSRINRLGTFIIQEIRRETSKGGGLSADRLTNIIFKEGIARVKELIHQFTDDKSEIVFLFDNIDKGWPANGVHQFDVRMVRLLVEALDKIKRDFHVQHREFLPVLFLRNDIYELMVEETPDRGKAGQVRIDWNDRAKLKQVIYRRLQSSTKDKSDSFEVLWGKYFTDRVSGGDAFEYLVDHSLMRPRFLITLLENAIANAVNRGHAIVGEIDCLDAVAQQSNYLVSDFGYEIRDVSGVPSDILYSLIGTPHICTRSEIIERFLDHGLPAGEAERAFKLMLWYGVVGIINRNNQKSFIYDFGYDLRRLEAELRMLKDNELFVLNPAFMFH